MHEPKARADWREKAIELMKELDLEEMVSRVYLYLLENGAKGREDISSGIGVGGEDLAKTLKTLLEKGCIIDHPSETYTPLHPRMALTNAYHMVQTEYEERLKEKRMMVDQIAFLLEPEYEKRVLGSGLKKGSF